MIRDQRRNFVMQNRTPVIGLIEMEWIYIGTVMVVMIAEIGG